MLILGENLLERVAGIIPRYSMLPAGGGRIGVAVSGGADSVVLLHILSRLAPKFGLELTVVHVNHRLRGSESEEDEAFVRSLAQDFGLECLVEQAPIGQGNLEQEARRARGAFFARCMVQNNLTRVALGHTKSDQAETVLFRLLRGSGIAGLAGMRLVTSDGLIRPLLTTTREEVRDWARGQGIGWREDSSNSDPGFARNRLRNQAIPALQRDFNPNLEGVLAAMAEVAASEEDYWIQQIEPIYQQLTKRTHLGSILQVGPFGGLHAAVQRRVLRRALCEIRGDLRSIDAEHVEAIRGVCSSSHGHDRVIVPGVDALRSFDSLLLARPGELSAGERHYRMELRFGETCELPFRAGFVRAIWVKPGERNCVNFEGEQEFTAEVSDLNGELAAPDSGPVSLFVRNWEPGDQLERPGHQKPEKIKSLFQEQRVVLWERRHWPVVVRGNDVIWARHFGAAAKFRMWTENCPLIRILFWANP